jgi:hypothetical protein
MHDCENEVYTKVATMLRDKFPGIDVASTYVRTPSKFPHVSFEMSNIDTLRMLQTTDTKEAFSRCVFDINIYSNDPTMKKSICKEIAHAIDDLLMTMNFNRLYLKPVANFEDQSIYRIVARYRVATDGKYFYRR